jgi:transmembrane sensor
MLTATGTIAAHTDKPVEVAHEAMAQAAEWYALLISGEATAADQASWQSWLDADPDHRRAWGYVESVSQRVLAPLQQTADPRVTSDNLWAANDRLLKRRRALARVVARGVAFTGAGLLGWGVSQRDSVGRLVERMAADHRTGVGDIRQVILSDGTSVWLNTASALNVDYQPALRRLHLAAGEMLVTTAADPLRPLVVDTAQGRMRALGTRFAVRQEEDQTLLAVYHGKVAIQTAGSGATVVLAAGQQTVFDRETVRRPVPADPARQAWSQGQLIAWDMALKDVVAELRRYHRGHLGVAPELAERRVFGTYPLRDVPATLSMLADATHARLRSPLPWWTSIEADASAPPARP